MDDALDNLWRHLSSTGLGDDDLCAALHVTRAELDAWRAAAVAPASPAAHDAAAVITLLADRVRPEAFAAVLSRPMPGLADRTVLEALEDDAPATRAVIEHTFDYSGTA